MPRTVTRLLDTPLTDTPRQTEHRESRTVIRSDPCRSPSTSRQYVRCCETILAWRVGCSCVTCIRGMSMAG